MAEQPSETRGGGDPTHGGSDPASEVADTPPEDGEKQF